MADIFFDGENASRYVGSVENLFDYFGGRDLTQIIAAVGATQEGHHLEPVHYGRLFLEELPSQVFLPVLQSLQLISKHLRVYYLSLRLDILALPLK